MPVSVYEQLKKAIQDFIAPEIKALQVEIRRLDEKIDSGLKRLDEKMELGFKRLDEKMDSGFRRLDDKIDSVRNELVAEIKRLDARIDSLDTRIDSLEKGLQTAIEIRERLSAIEAKIGL